MLLAVNAFVCLFDFPPSLFPSLPPPPPTKLGHNWTPYFKYVIEELEKNDGQGAVESREKEMRQKIDEVIPCNIREETILESTKFVPFDIIQTNLCFEAVCETMEEFGQNLRKLKDLLKPGGYVLCLTSRGGSWYTCAGGGTKFHMLKIDEKDLIQAFKDSGE